MTPRDTGVQDTPTAAVRVRAAEGDVDETSLARIRAKVLAALDRPGLPPLGGEVRITRAAARHTEQPWSAGGEIRVGADLVVVHAQEATAYRLADRLHDRLRGQVERVVHRGETARRTSAPPPWRGGPGGAQSAEASPGS
ncbi:hypothetical protein JS756_06265 [Streptomyces actuosus]|uniref:Asp23/Gls24 family protein n=1 Tax=Streptomyces actuosus TaxID=1885 RepID=A0ABS2VL00_STRAS|nr:hypothetical protein [Streptomyces actuosus]MBN0043716.1 hypothetical protein [Streptomyces actuosus]